MDITTSLAAPSSSNNNHKGIYSSFITVLGIITKFAILVYIHIVSSNIASLANNKDIGNERNDNAIEEIILHQFWYPLSAVIKMMQEKITFDTEFGLARVVAAALTYHIGFCCLFVAMIHLGVIKAR